MSKAFCRVESTQILKLLPTSGSVLEVVIFLTNRPSYLLIRPDSKPERNLKGSDKVYYSSIIYVIICYSL